MLKIYIANNITNLKYEPMNNGRQIGLFHVKYENYGLLVALYKEVK